MPISLDKLQERAPGLVNLRKAADDVIEQKNLLGVTLPVYYVTDMSGSTAGMWHDGTMQKGAEEILAMATAFSDTGEIELWAFGDQVRKAGVIGIDPNDSASYYQGAMSRLTKHLRLGPSTNLTDTIYQVAERIAGSTGHLGRTTEHRKGGFLGLGGRKESVTEGEVASSLRSPVLVIVQTDGEPNDEYSAAQALVDVSIHPIFWQFQAMGGGPFDFLTTLNDPDDRNQPTGNIMDDVAKIVAKRKIDNVGVFFGMPGRSDLYDGLLNELPSYLPLAASHGMTD